MASTLYAIQADGYAHYTDRPWLAPSVHMVSFPVQHHSQLHPLDPSEVRQPRPPKHPVEIRLHCTSGHFQFFSDFSLITPQQQQQFCDLVFPWGQLGPKIGQE